MLEMYTSYRETLPNKEVRVQLLGIIVHL